MPRFLRIASCSIIFSALLLSPAAAQSDVPPRFREVMSIELRQIQSVVWHPGGEIIAAAGEQDVWLYDADTLTDVAHLDLRPIVADPWLYGIKWSPDGKWLLGHVNDGWRVWEYDEGQFIRVLDDLTITDIYWSPDGSQYVIVNDEGSHVYAGITGELMRSYVNVTLKWSPNSGTIAAIGESAINLINSMTFETMRVLQDDERALDPDQVYWSSNSRKIAAISNDRVLAWDARTGGLLFAFLNDDSAPDSGGREGLDTIWWMPHSETFLVETDGSWPEPIFMYELNAGTGEMLNSGGTDGRIIAVRLTPDGSKLIINFLRHDISGYHEVDTSTWAYGPLFHIGYPFFSEPVWNSDGSLIAHSKDTGMVQILDGNSFEPINEFHSQIGIIQQFVWSPNGHELAILTAAELQVWNIFSGEMLAEFNKVGGNQSWNAEMGVAGWSADGQYFATTVKDLGHAISIWDVSSRQNVSILYSPIISFQQWSSSSRSEMITVEDALYYPTQTIIRDASTGEIVYSLNENYNLVSSSPGDGRYLAGVKNGDAAATIEIWDRALNALEGRVEYPARIETLLWHPSGDMLVAVTVNEVNDVRNYTLAINDVITGERLISKRINEGEIALSFDGDLLAHSGNGLVTVYPLAQMLDIGFELDGLQFAYPGVVFETVHWHPTEAIFAVVGEVRMGDYENSPREDYLYIWDISAATHTVQTARVLNSLVDFAWRPDGTLVYATRNDWGVIHLWEQVR
jgi:WD40 repeat protein